jgi:hypothetical protein
MTTPQEKLSAHQTSFHILLNASDQGQMQQQAAATEIIQKGK